jgi:hypothetical protein
MRDIPAERVRLANPAGDLERNYLRVSPSLGLAGFRRLARDFERNARAVAALIRLAIIRIMLNVSLKISRHESNLRGWALRRQAADAETS